MQIFKKDQPNTDYIGVFSFLIKYQGFFSHIFWKPIKTKIFDGTGGRLTVQHPGNISL